MSQQLSQQELLKAARNLEKIEGFFLARTTWTVGDEAREALEDLWQAVLGLTESVQDLITRHSVEMSRLGDATQVTMLPSSSIDATRVGKFATFVNQLHSWFSSHKDQELGSDGIEAVRQTYRALASMRRALDTIQSGELAAHAAAMETAEPEPELTLTPAEDAATEAPSPPPEIAADGTALPPLPPLPRAARPANAAARLVLHDTDESPKLQTFKGTTELTFECKQLLDEFLADNRIELGKYDLRKFQDKVLRWLLATPDGQILILKIGGLHGRVEPYPSYVPRDEVVPRT